VVLHKRQLLFIVKKLASIKKTVISL